MNNPKRKAIALLSGGLDSHLAARLIKDQGIEVVGLYLASPFGCATEVEAIAKELDIRLIVKAKGDAYLDLVKNPRYGYGKNMNPCIDCRIFMFQLADVVRQEEGADFIITGEVVGQRPMSQHKSAMKLIERKSPLEDLLVRPLCAHSFPPSVAEREGWVDREKLLRISGRSRAKQFEWAEKLGIKTYAPPGGGCLLTEAAFSTKLRDFFYYEGEAPSPELRQKQAALLAIGRHFRLSDDTKLIVARNQPENEALAARWRDARGAFFYPANFDGPNAIGFGVLDESGKKAIGELIARYGKSGDLNEKEIGYKTIESSGTFVVYHPMPEERIEALRI